MACIEARGLRKAFRVALLVATLRSAAHEQGYGLTVTHRDKGRCATKDWTSSLRLWDRFSPMYQQPSMNLTPFIPGNRVDTAR
jgi:hypothetical protein